MPSDKRNSITAKATGFLLLLLLLLFPPTTPSQKACVLDATETTIMGTIKSTYKAQFRGSITWSVRDGTASPDAHSKG